MQKETVSFLYILGTKLVAVVYFALQNSLIFECIYLVYYNIFKNVYTNSVVQLLCTFLRLSIGLTSLL